MTKQPPRKHDLSDPDCRALIVHLREFLEGRGYSPDVIPDVATMLLMAHAEMRLRHQPELPVPAVVAALHKLVDAIGESLEAFRAKREGGAL